jgi:3',5'-cyclic AMP phosphodiesterase CpdA
MNLLHLSDPHFGTERAPVCEALLAFAHDLDPDVIVLSGDLTQRATEAQFATAADFVRRLPAAPLLALPGNHDLPLYNLWQRFVAPYARYATHFGDTIDRVWRGSGVQLIGVNTTRPWRQQHGALSPQQIARVALQLRAADSQQWRIVVTHHPLVVTREQDLADRPLGYNDALRRWCDAGADVLLSGHIHLPSVVRWHAPGGGSAWVVKAGSAVSRRTVDGVANSVNVLTQMHERGRRQRSVTRWDYDAERARFVAAATHTIDPPAPPLALQRAA